jgi:two-component system, OmpR family, sensor kinase
MTIRTKLILWYSGLLTFIIVLFAVIVFLFTRWTLVSAIDNTLNETAAQVISNSRAFPVGEFASPESVSVRLPPLDVFRASGVYVQVWDISGDEPQFAAASQNISDLTVPLAANALMLREPIYQNVQFGENELRVLTRPVVLPNGIEIVSVQVGASLETVNESADRMLTILMLAMALAITGSIGMGLLLAHRALQPIDNMIKAAALIAETDDLTTRLDWHGPMDELGRLTSVFNVMMDRLEHLFGVQQRFVADVSHELRTPLTAIRGNLELAERYGMDDQMQEAVSSEVGRMARMVDDLLLLARADYGGMKLDLGPLDLDTVVNNAYREAKAIIHARGDDLNVQMGRFEPTRVSGNADRLKQLLLNLVGNAVKFTPAGGTVKLSLSEEGDYAVMRVSDTGIGIAEEDLPLIFDRFYQAESSRANSERDIGTGLGLSICKWIAEAHGGTIRVESHLGRGTTFTISIPRIDYTAPTRTSMVIPEEYKTVYRQNGGKQPEHISS